MSHNFRESVAPECPPGYILRKSYTTNKGTYVPARCIEERGLYKKIPQNIEKIKKVENEIKEVCKHENCPESCPKGEILRKGYKRGAYTRENGTYVHSTIVPPDCVKNQGKPGKGPKLIKINPVDHILSDQGYDKVKDLSLDERHRALKKVITVVGKYYGKRQALIYIIKALNARYILTKNTSPESSKVFKEDRNWASGLLKEWKEKHPGDKKDKKTARLVLLGPTTTFLAAEGYRSLSGLKVEERHEKLKKVLKKLVDLMGEKKAFLDIIRELNARAKMGMAKSQVSAKFLKDDADWLYGIYKEWKEKQAKKNNKKKSKFVLAKKV